MENGADDEKTCYVKFELGIQDFGCGISPEQLDKLFINFNNLEEHRKNNPSGRGLGLSICKLIVEQMGGEVKVTSELNKGSIFSIIFCMMCKVTNPPCPSPVNNKNEVFNSVSRRQMRQSR